MKNLASSNATLGVESMEASSRPTRACCCVGDFRRCHVGAAAMSSRWAPPLRPLSVYRIEKVNRNESAKLQAYVGHEGGWMFDQLPPCCDTKAIPTCDESSM